jgi:hypothetical protein
VGAFLASIVFSVLPEFSRRRLFSSTDVNAKHGAIVSGVVQMFGCLGLIWLRYPAYIHGRMAATEALVTAKTGGDKMMLGIADFSVGFLGLWEFLFQPLNLLLFYFALEGIVRVFAAVATSEMVPSLPLQIIGWFHQRARAGANERAMGPRVVDVVTAGDGIRCDLRIESCRPKDDWHELMTVSFNDELFEISEQMEATQPRPWIYLLRKVPAGKVIRGIRSYDPSEVLQKR